MMLELRKIDNQEVNEQLFFSFEKANPNWKESYQMGCFLLEIPVPKQGSLSDYDYFKRMRRTQKQQEQASSEDYLLLDKNHAVSSIHVIMRNRNIADLSFFTAPSERRKGYASKAVALIENKLFQNPELLFTTMFDMTQTGVTTKLALKSGYVFDEDAKLFVKANPNIDLEKFSQEQKRTK